MVISAYQVNNVLRVYGDQLRQGRVTQRVKDDAVRAPDRINISIEAKRKAIVDKIASDIVEKIGQYGHLDSMEKDVSQKLENEYGVQLDITKGGPSELIFKVIDGSGESLNSVSIEDSGFSGYKIEQISQDTPDEDIY